MTPHSRYPWPTIAAAPLPAGTRVQVPLRDGTLASGTVLHRKGREGGTRDRAGLYLVDLGNGCVLAHEREVRES